MGQALIHNHLEEIRALEKKKAALMQDVERLGREVSERAESLADINRRIQVAQLSFESSTDEFRNTIEDRRAAVEGVSVAITGMEESAAKVLGVLQGLENDAKEAEKALSGVQVRKEVLEREEREILGRMNDAKSEYARAKEASESELSDILKKIQAGVERLDAITAECDRKHSESVAEDRRLAVRQKDLEIYEQRLRKQYPEATIIL